MNTERIAGRVTACLKTAALAAAVLLSAALPAAAQSWPTAAQSWSEIVAAAKREGTVLLYNNLQPSGVEPLLAKFRAAYPEIAVESVRLGAAPLAERFATEFAAGRNLADAVITFPDERLVKGIEEGWMEQWTPPELPNFPNHLNRDKRLFTLQHAREAIVWNTRLVTDADAPKEWADLFDPKWKGRIGMNPPWRAVAIQQIIAYWEDQLGLGDTAAKLKESGVRFFEGSGGLAQAIVRGDVAVAQLTDLPLNGLLEDGAPIGFAYPQSGTTLSAGMAFVAKNAPRPNAAKVLVNWLMTKDGQLALQEHGGLAVTRKGAPALSKIPATARLPKVVEGEKLLTAKRQEEIVNHWRTVFGIR